MTTLLWVAEMTLLFLLVMGLVVASVSLVVNATIPSGECEHEEEEEDVNC